ncbi:uncharacterized protein LOC135366692 isoform X2 [Ornithodoros turicata]|uniref:uncharacterized protein LOC135366692 isoform X2 n=1 Tax=Ornithodoros turicata TaxID=34597 RepID=UPI003138C19A
MKCTVVLDALIFICSFCGVSGCCAYSPKSKFKEPVYLETHVYADYGYLKFYNKNDTKAKEYVVEFWNSVELRFSNLLTPLRLPLVDITFLSEDDDKKIFGNGNHPANTSSSMMSFKESMKDKQGPDLVYVLTSRSLYTGSPERKIKAAGGAYVDGGVCTEYNIAMGIDIPGNFTGCLWAVRHLAKVIGARDDGKNGSRCPPSGGFLMANTDAGGQFQYFSLCSNEDIENHLLRINSSLSPPSSSCLERNQSLRDIRRGFMNLKVAAQSLSLRSRCQAYFGNDKWSCRRCFFGMCLYEADYNILMKEREEKLEEMLNQEQQKNNQ